MPKVFCAVPGLSIRLDNYGLATDGAGVEVPEAVAVELRKDSRFRVESAAPAKKPKESDTAPRLRPRRVAVEDKKREKE